MSTSFLLKLPREVRDMIYEHYTRTDGYIHNFETNKLRQANGSPIDLSLTLTCRQIAQETNGLGLLRNTITFSTFFSENTREPAGLFHAAVTRRKTQQAVILGRLAPKLLTPEMAEKAIKEYPALTPIIHTWSQRGDMQIIRQQDVTYGEAPSLWAEFVQFVLTMLSKHPAFLEEARALIHFWTPVFGCNALELINGNTDPWAIPDSEELEDLVATNHVEANMYDYFDHIKYSYSAASVTIRFFKSLPANTRARIRNVILREDYESVSNPECHGKRLLPFCVENPKLHVERFVSLWQHAFPVEVTRSSEYTIHGAFTNMHIPPPEWLRDDKLASCGVTKSISKWIAETLLLPSLGLPEGSYTLIFDGEPTPEKSAEVFDIVQRDAAWQAALDLCYERGLLPQGSWLDRRLRKGYFYDSLLTAIRNLSEDSALIRCNFNPGLPHSAEDLVDEHHGWSLQDWERGWDTHEPREFQTEQPLPPWHVLRWQRVIPLPSTRRYFEGAREPVTHTPWTFVV
jgi:hypothetical protein